ncbi:MAG TPA: OmpA family protein [Aquaticitalea sp.]|nr:OmpA family protein [Aquaticitalea sp.]
MKKIHTSLLLSLMCFVFVQAQEQSSNRKKAVDYLNSYQYGKAILLYQKLTDVKEPKLEDMENLAFSYSQVNDYEHASNWYAKVVEHSESAPENLLRYAKTLKQTARYADAKVALKRYAEVTGNQNEVETELAGCDAASEWMANPLPYNIVNEEGINTPLSEFATFVLGNDVYYAGEEASVKKVENLSWTGQSFLRVYRANVDGAGLNKTSESVVFNDDNRYHIGPVSSNKAGDTFFVTRTYSGKDGDKNKEGRVTYKTNRLELFIYKKDGDSWTKQPFAYNNIQQYSVGHAALSPDEDTLYFVSDMEGGVGGTDIWYSEKQSDGSWGQPKNAGAINGTKDELFPNLGADGVLYFSSDSFVGMGGLDIFKSEGSKGTWSQPENLKYPVNSGGDDFAFVATKVQDDTLSGFFSSNRAGGKGNDDIYAFNYHEVKPKIIVVLEGISYQYFDAKIPMAGVDVSLNLFDEHRTLIGQSKSDANGFFSFEVEAGKDFILLGEKKEYYSDSLTVSTKHITQNDTIRVNLNLKPVLEVGKKFVLEGIYYDYDKYNIREDAQLVLNELVRIMQENPTLKIELSSHTDSRGRDSYNQVLSQNRAQSAVSYLVERGISRDRMVAKGYGETRLINACKNNVKCSEEDHQRNRRTEIEVLSF